jgi:hypothetical protein
VLSGTGTVMGQLQHGGLDRRNAELGVYDARDDDE